MDAKQTINKAVLEALKAGKLEKDVCLMILKELNDKKLAQDIAVIGMSGRYSGADNLEAYWENLKGGCGAISHFPLNREKVEGVKAGYSAGFLDDIGSFDADFFEINEKEALNIDPNQRIFLEQAWEALEDAGYTTSALKNTEVGVFVGLESSMQLKYQGLSEKELEGAEFGCMHALTASRLSYFLNVKGPSMVVDSMCTSGALAVHLGCQSIRQKESSMVIAGGINLVDVSTGERKMDNITSDEGKVCVFDKAASGMVWGDGCGVVILKDLQTALKDGDHIYAVIKGSATNNDGQTSDLTSPNFKKQSEAIVKAWQNAGVNPETINYIESHGTGTLVGDSIEFKAIKESFEKFTNKKQFCGIGSVKPSIGHTVAASAIASLQKVILAMNHQEIPATISFEEPNPLIDFSNSPCYVNDRLNKWETNGEPRRAGVNSFSFTRTNCHIVVEEAPEVKVEAPKAESYIFLLSAKNSTSLKRSIAKYEAFLSKNEAINIRDLCYTAAVGREHEAYRMALVVKDAKDLALKLKLAKESEYKSYTDLYESLKEQTQKLKEVNRQGQGILESSEGSLAYAALEELAKLYIQGMNINFNACFKGEACFRISLPTYAFDRKLYWANPVNQQHQLTQKAEITEQVLEETASEKVTSEEVVSKEVADSKAEEESRKAVRIIGGNGTYSELEITIANIWGNILNLEEVPINKSLEDIGGNSIDSVKVQMAIEDEFDVDLDDLDIMLDYSSIEAQVLMLEEVLHED